MLLFCTVWCVFYIHQTSQTGLVTFQVLTTHTWPVATMSHGAALTLAPARKMDACSHCSDDKRILKHYSKMFKRAEKFP